MRKPTRRRVLGLAAGGSIGAALAGCGMFDDSVTPASVPAAPDALLPMLAETVALAARYDRAVAAQPGLAGRLTPLAADHRAHATELARLIGVPVPTPMAEAGATPSGPAAAAAPAGVLALLRTAEQTAQRNAAAACTAAPPERTALIGSIAACRAAHVEALR